MKTALRFIAMVIAISGCGGTSSSSGGDQDDDGGSSSGGGVQPGPPEGVAIQTSAEGDLTIVLDSGATATCEMPIAEVECGWFVSFEVYAPIDDPGIEASGEYETHSCNETGAPMGTGGGSFHPDFTLLAQDEGSITFELFHDLGSTGFNVNGVHTVTRCNF